MISSPSTAGIGHILDEIADESLTSCSVTCANNIMCNGANYIPGNKTCTLLQVEDVLKDWERNDAVTYICVDCKPGPERE